VKQTSCRRQLVVIAIIVFASMISAKTHVNAAAMDFDGDGRTDLAVYQTGTGHWFLLRSTLGFGSHLAFGGSGFLPMPADYDGDGTTDVAVYEEATGNWFIAQSSAGFRVHPTFGGPGFIPVPGDYDGDGKTDVAVYQASTGNWFIAGSTAGFLQHLAFGGPGFVPVPGDYDGDGVTDTAVYDTTTGNWFIAQSSAGFRVHPTFGGPGFIPVPGDYDGDGKTDVAVYQAGTGNWFIAGSTAGFLQHLAFGGPGLVPVPGDYDGDGVTDIAVYAGSNGNWFIAQSTAGFQIYPAFGGSEFVPALPEVSILSAWSALVFTPPAVLPAGTVGVPYLFSFCQPQPATPTSLCGEFPATTDPTGGQVPYHFQLDSGVGFPPLGLNLNLNGLLTGTPSATGTRTFRVCAVDLAGFQSCETVSLTINATAAWTGVLTASSTPQHCPLGGDKGEFSLSYSLSLSFPSSLIAALQGGQTIQGTGTVSGVETVARQSSFPSICSLVETTVSNVPVTANASSFGIIVSANDTLIFNRYFNPSTGNNDAGVSSLVLTPSFISPTHVTGSWQTSGGGSTTTSVSAAGFTLTQP
jgi:hypothetical protein